MPLLSERRLGLAYLKSQKIGFFLLVIGLSAFCVSDERSFDYIPSYLVSRQSPSIENYCVTESKEKPVLRLHDSDHAMLPVHKTRNISDHRFVVHNGEQALSRKPQAFDYMAWQDTLAVSGGKEQAHTMKQSLEPIVAAGKIDYEIHEAWRWQRCEVATDASCGSYYQCQLDPGGAGSIGPFYVEGYLSAKQISDFNCSSRLKSCHRDKTVDESLFCSNETMTYEYTFIRPDASSWNINSPTYEPYLANKYDLLPGEVEHFFIHTGGSGLASISSHRLTPQLVFEECFNDYDMVYTGSAHDDSVLLPGKAQHLDIEIHTLKRKVTRTPNPLTIAKTWDGEKVEPILWQGEMCRGNYIEKAIPNALILQDTSAESIRYFSNQSISKTDKDDKPMANKTFMKNTKIKVSLYEKGSMWRLWKRKKLGKVYIDDTDVVQASLNALSNDQEVQLSDLWKIPLDGEGHEKSIYESENSWFFKLFSKTSFRRHLKPSTEYTLEVAVYRKDFSFYTQEKEKKANIFSRLYHWLSGSSEDSYYSKPFMIHFTTQENLDNRVFWEKVEDPFYFSVSAAAVAALAGATFLIVNHYR